MIKVVLFDADGVLINGEMFSVQLKRDYKITTDITKSFFSGSFKDCIIGKKDLKDVLPRYLKEWGLNQSVEEFLDYWFKSEHHINQKLINRIQELRKKGIICCLATNQEKYRIEYILNKMSFSKVFDRIYASAHLGYKKPDVLFWDSIMKDLKDIDKNEVLFWDNTSGHVRAAKNFGIRAEVYTNLDNFDKKMSKYFSL